MWKPKPPPVIADLNIQFSLIKVTDSTKPFQLLVESDGQKFQFQPPVNQPTNLLMKFPYSTGKKVVSITRVIKNKPNGNIKLVFNPIHKIKNSGSFTLVDGLDIQYSFTFSTDTSSIERIQPGMYGEKTFFIDVPTLKYQVSQVNLINQRIALWLNLHSHLLEVISMNSSQDDPRNCVETYHVTVFFRRIQSKIPQQQVQNPQSQQNANLKN